MTERTARPLAGGVGLLLAAVALLGCSAQGPQAEAAGSTAAAIATTSTLTSTTAGPTATPSLPTAPGSTEQATTAPPAVDGSAALGQALDALAPGYHFTTTVTVDGAVTVMADGDRIADGSRFSLTRDGAAVSYVITPGGTWVQPEGGEWEELDSGPATTDPIAALRTPTSVQLDASSGTVVQLTVGVPAVALGIPGDPSTTTSVQVTLDGTAVRDITYAVTVDGHPTVVQAVIGPPADPTPVTPPA